MGRCLRLILCSTTNSVKVQRGAVPNFVSQRWLAGHEALQALEKGSVMRKKWVGSTSAEAANHTQKTERLIRCRVENNRVLLHYHHQVPPPSPDYSFSTCELSSLMLCATNVERCVGGRGGGNKKNTEGREGGGGGGF